jgi:FKBP-type peptidyl-prolyl cis-trans isomerase FklB
MKAPLPLAVACALLVTVVPLLGQATTPPKTQKEQLGYALGVDVAQTLKRQPIDFDPQQFAAAVRDVLTGGQPQMTEEQVHDVLMSFSKDMATKQQAAQQAAAAQSAIGADKNKKAGEDFLAANKNKPGVQTLSDGLQYKVIKEGKGPMPKASDSVTVKYRGTLLDGTVFDDSEKHADPSKNGTETFPVGGVIKGWTEALQKMHTGSKWQIFIPAELAYGDSGAGGTIPPGSTLVFDVELVSINK